MWPGGDTAWSRSAQARLPVQLRSLLSWRAGRVTARGRRGVVIFTVCLTRRFAIHRTLCSSAELRTLAARH